MRRAPAPVATLLLAAFLVAAPMAAQTTPPSADTQGAQTQAAPDTDPTISPLRRVGGAVLPPKLVHKADPQFSIESRRVPFKGVVLVNFIVDTKGMPRNVHVLRGVGMGLDENAVAAVKKYRFQPATEGGRPVPVEINVEVNFQVTP